MSLAVQLFSNVKLLIQNKASPESILLYVQFKTNSYFGRCFTKTDSPVDSKEFVKLMARLDEELLKLEDVWKESYGNTNEKIMVLKKNLIQKFNFKCNNRIVQCKVSNYFR